MKLTVRYNGVPPNRVVAECNRAYTSDSGSRVVTLAGWAESEGQARHRLIAQAKAMRDELNVAIEEMIDQLVAQAR